MKDLFLCVSKNIFVYRYVFYMYACLLLSLFIGRKCLFISSFAYKYVNKFIHLKIKSFAMST